MTESALPDPAGLGRTTALIEASFGAPVASASSAAPGSPGGPYGQHWAPPQGQPELPFAAYPAYARGTNPLAILSLVFGLLQPIIGIILGHVSLGQIRRTGEEGRSLALAGLAIGYGILALGVIFVGAFAAFYLTIVVAAISSSGH